jgi:hypothetical protein
MLPAILAAIREIHCHESTAFPPRSEGPLARLAVAHDYLTGSIQQRARTPQLRGRDVGRVRRSAVVGDHALFVGSQFRYPLLQRSGHPRRLAVRLDRYDQLSRGLSPPSHSHAGHTKEVLQVVITTHSPHFIDILGLEGIALVRKGPSGTVVTQMDREQLVAHGLANGVPESRASVESVLPFYAAVATPQILEGFFAKVVVLVEGPTEAVALPSHLARCKVIPARVGVGVIPVGGKGNLAKWHRLFSAYGIPTYIVFDNDGKSDDPAGAKRRDALRALGVAEDESEAIVEAKPFVTRMGGRHDSARRQHRSHETPRVR